jgi:diguanylate cyclase (GGDEF)-like protein
MLGYSREEMLELSVPDIDPFFPMEIWAEHWQELKLKGSLRFETKHKARDGHCYPVEIVANYLEYEGVEYNCALVRDISERKTFEAEFELRANTDYLTNVGNRQHFMEEAERELLRAARYGEPLSLLMLDIDFFKRINDAHGHAIGDEALKTLAETCRRTLREVDIIGRLGGEEFAVLLPETDLHTAAEAAERLRATIAQAHIPVEKGSPVSIAASIGVASLNAGNLTVDRLLNAADKALYEAKRAGRDRVRVEALSDGEASFG